MIKVTFIQNDTKDTETVEVPPNTTVMEAARFYSKYGYIRGIDADCGGTCSCGTCHVYVHKDWIDRIGNISEKTPELEVLEYEKDFDSNYSRLGCQIVLQKEHDGLVVYVP